MIAEVTGPRAALLTAERTALNFLQRLSGIATLTRRFVDAAARPHHGARHAQDDAALRALEKYAVRAGGGTNHRDRPLRRHPDQGQPRPPGRRRGAGARADAGGAPGPADRDRGAEPRPRSTRPSRPAPTSSCSTTCSIAEVREAVRRIAGRAKDRDLGRRHARAHARARGHRRGLRLGRRADALGAGRRHQLRDRTRAGSRPSMSDAAPRGVRRRPWRPRATAWEPSASPCITSSRPLHQRRRRHAGGARRPRGGDRARVAPEPRPRPPRARLVLAAGRRVVCVGGVAGTARHGHRS